MTRIVVYDSGVGGLTIYQQLRQRLEPNAAQHSLVFVSDNAAYPYGTKADAELISRVSSTAQAIVDSYHPDILVVACNTASTLALQTLRDQLECEVVGVVPAIKPAAQMSQTKVIGLLATPATIERDYTRQLINDFAQQCQLINVGSSDLVEMAEAKLAGHSIDHSRLSDILQPFIDSANLDVLVLACTHFPLLAEEIGDVFYSNKRSVSLVDSGDAIARRVLSLAGSKANYFDKTNELDAIASFTDVGSIDSGLVRYLKSQGFVDVQQLIVE